VARTSLVQHNYMRCFFVAAATVSFSIQAQPATAASLPPVGKWTVDFGDDRCVAFRAFGHPRHPVLLLLKPSPVGDVLQLQIAEKGINRPGTQDKVNVTFGNDAPLALLQLQYGVSGQSVRMVNLSAQQAARLSVATTLRWSERGKQYELGIGPMAKLMQTLDRCKDMLADRWNATLTKRMALKVAPTIQTPIGSLFSSNDYPWDALRSGQTGLAHVVLMVDATGRLADCTLIATSGVALIDAQTCIILRKRGKFTPAIGSDGKPTRGVIHERVNWEMP
jgi:hypothetical protein